MGIHSQWGRHIQRWTSTQPQREHLNRDGDTRNSNNSIKRNHNNWYRNKFVRLIRSIGSTSVHNNNARRRISIQSDIQRTRYDEPNNNTKSDSNKKRNRHNKYVYPVIATGLVLNSLLPIKALAEGVGGVSATANPIANSSGSVTNQAIQVLQGPYITNTYGGGVQCQGSTFNLTPYVQFADSRKDPWVDFYNEPQYNMTDLSGRTSKQTVTVKNYPWEDWYDTRTKADGSRWFEDGDDIQVEIDVDGPDGVPDVVGSGGTMTPTWMKPIRTDMSANQSFNAGLSATLSIPLNRKLVKQCHQAAAAQIEMQTQLISNKRLDFEIARLKNCGELKKQGIFFHPASPYHSVCADVVVTTPGGKLLPHTHDLPEVKFNDPSSREVNPSSLDTDQSSSLEESASEGSSQSSSELSQSLSSPQALSPSGASQLGVWQVGQMSSPQQQSQP